MTKTKLAVLVTGGAGFIGSHLVKQLKMSTDRDFYVTVFDNLSTGKFSNLEWSKPDDFVHGDLAKPENISSLFRRTFDVVFHVGAEPSIVKSETDPISSHASNVNGTLNLLEASRHNRVAKFVFSSTCALYDVNGVASERSPIKPNSFYAAHKLACEQLIGLYHEKYGLDSVILRYFNVFGPYQSNSTYGAVIPNFIDKLIHKNRPYITGDGTQTRDFIYVDDVARANIAALDISNPGCSHIFNVGSGRGVSINELLQIMTKKIKSKVTPIRDKKQAVGLQNSCADTSKLRSISNWRSRTTLEDGIALTIEARLAQLK